MKGLLLKDIYTLGNQTKLFLGMMVLFAVLPGSSLSACAIIYASLLPTTALAYDEHAKWQWLAAMMPYSTTSLVVSKYLLGYLAVIATTLLSFAAQVIYALVTHHNIAHEELGALLCISCIAFLFLAIDLPLLFRFGSEKSRMALLIPTVVIICGSFALQDTLASGGLSQLEELPLLPICAVVMVVANALSIPLSLSFYRKQLS